MNHKAISLWQPWASLITFGFKKYETRSWRTSYRGKLVICSAQKSSKQQQTDYSTFAEKYQVDVDWDSLPFGQAIAVCDLTDCIKMSNDFIQTISKIEQECGDWKTDRYAWKLNNIEALSPTAVTGKQGLWNIENGVLEESKKLSPPNAVGDTKNQALQRFLSRAKLEQKVKTFAIVKTYQPNGRKTEYFRLDYRVGKKTKSIHIPGGNIWAKLAQDRATEIQTMIDCGAELMELMAMIESYRS